MLDVALRNPATGTERFCRAIIDTAAGPCLVRESLALELGLLPFGETLYQHPLQGRKPMPECRADLVLDSGHPKGEVLVLGLRFGIMADPEFPADAILGIELLHECRLMVDWPSGHCELMMLFGSVSKIP